MPALQKLSDADLIERLRVRRDHSAADAAAILGIGTGQLRETVAEAKRRGLRASDTIPDELATLRAQLKVSEATLAKTRKDNLTVATLRRTLFGLSEVPPAPPAWASEIAKSPSARNVPCVFWSDHHWGETVFPEQVGGVNEYNMAIAEQRFDRLVNKTVTLAKQHMGALEYPGIVVMLGGDMISGGIHEELRETNDGTIQQTLLRVQDKLAAGIAHMADEFGAVFVPGVVGNHGRMKAKPHAKNAVYENYEWGLYHQLERHFRNDSRVHFHIPDETDAHFNVLGERFMMTHGNFLGVKGGDGIIGAIGPIARGTMKIGRSEAQIGRDFDTLCMGHWHTYIPRGEAAPVIVNGAMKGYDEYARLFLRVPYSRPSQALWFVNAEHGITAQWQVYLDQARKSSGSASWVEWEQRR